MGGTCGPPHPCGPVTAALGEAADQPAHRGPCAVCGQWAADAVVIAEVHTDSGPGWTQYAHPTCVRPRRRRVEAP